MSGGAGFSRDGMNRTPENRGALKDIRKKYFRIKRSNNESNNYSTLPESDPRIVNEIRHRMMKEKRKSNVISTLLLSILAILLLIVISILFK